MHRSVKVVIIVLISAYVLFGIFCLNIPSVRSDELWETSRAYYLGKNLHPGEPLLPKEIAPFFATIQELGWKSWFIGSLKWSTSALLMNSLPIDPLSANRLNGFLWSVAVCVLTFMLARRIGLNKWNALLCVSFLIALPEFFQQIHYERSEMLICALLLVAVLMMMKAFETQHENKKRLWYLATGLYAWLPSMIVHASAIVIPAVVGVMFLYKEWRSIFSLRTIVIGTGLMAGLFFFFYIKNAMVSYAVSHGGSDFYQDHACPPVICGGVDYAMSVPAIFYNKFVKTNIFTRPVSFIIFLVASSSLLFSLYRNRNNPLKENNFILLSCILIPLLIMLLLSGSYGNYNIIVAPFVVIGIVQLLQKQFQPGMSKILVPLMLLVLLAVNVPGMKSQSAAYNEYRRVIKELSEVIPAGRNVMGMNLYYLPFRDQNYYSVTWMDSSVGKPGLTFEDVVRMKNINYVIADDAFASRANYRGEAWADSLVNFLQTNAVMIQEIKCNLYLKIIPAENEIPVGFRYKEFQNGYVKRIRVYKING
jgi:hypothetical protein